jgi:hypothetical protein
MLIPEMPARLASIICSGRVVMVLKNRLVMDCADLSAS